MSVELSSPDLRREALALAISSLPNSDDSEIIVARAEAFALYLRGGAVTAATRPDRPPPAVPIDKSITDEHIFCLEDGRRLVSMKRHLAHLGMTPDEYRARWGLPADYPMVAPAYSRRRSQLAADQGLGTRQGGAPLAS